MSHLHPGAFTEVEQLQDELAAVECALRHYGLDAEDREPLLAREAELQGRLIFLDFWRCV
jgi:hypothetical protein